MAGAAFFLALAAALSDQVQPAPPRFQAGVEVVTVDVLVTSRGRPVTGLNTADFELLDNGVPQRIDSVEIEQIPVNVILALDLSESVSGERLRSLLRACRGVVEAMRAIDRAAILTFSHEIVERVPLTGDRDELLGELNRLTPGGSTSLYDAAYVGFRLSVPGQGRNLLLIFSDGSDSSSWLEPAEVLASSTRSDVVTYAVATQGIAADRPTEALMREPHRGRLRRQPTQRPVLLHDFLEQITSATGGRLLQAGDGTLPENFVEILREFQTRYLLTYAPREVDHPGWHEIIVRAKVRGAAIRARRGYWR